jgi:hypothetical protein
MIKKIIFVFVVLVFFSISIASAFTSDMLKSANNLASKWIINNHSDNPDLYGLDSNVLRQEIAAVSRWIAWLPKSTKCNDIFSDLSSTKPNSWACVNVEPLVENNLISKNNVFRPEDNITKAESLWMLIKSIWFDYAYNPDDSRTWQEQIVSYAVSKNIVDNFLDYDAPAKRWWVFEIADYSMEIRVKEKKKYSEETL